MAKEQRFERVYTQGALQITEIWVDKETGAAARLAHHVPG